MTRTSFQTITSIYVNWWYWVGSLWKSICAELIRKKIGWGNVCLVTYHQRPLIMSYDHSYTHYHDYELLYVIIYVKRLWHSS